MLAKRRKVSNLNKLRIRKRKEGGPGWKDEVWAGLKEVRSSNGCLNFGKVLTSQDFEFDFFFRFVTKSVYYCIVVVNLRMLSKVDTRCCDPFSLSSQSNMID